MDFRAIKGTAVKPFNRALVVNMIDLHGLWSVMAALKTSLPFVLAVTVAMSLLLASLVDRLEQSLLADYGRAGQS